MKPYQYFFPPSCMHINIRPLNPRNILKAWQQNSQVAFSQSEELRDSKSLDSPTSETYLLIIYEVLLDENMTMTNGTHPTVKSSLNGLHFEKKKVPIYFRYKGETSVLLWSSKLIQRFFMTEVTWRRSTSTRLLMHLYNIIMIKKIKSVPVGTFWRLISRWTRETDSIKIHRSAALLTPFNL